MTKLFVVVDSVSNDVAVSGNAVTPGVFVRTNAPVLARICPSFLQDFKLYEIGSVTSVTSQDVPVFESCTPVLHSWDCYKFPESPASPLSASQVSDLKKEVASNS